MNKENIKGPAWLKPHNLSDQEVFELLSRCLGAPVYHSVGMDESGNDVAIPVFGGQSHGSRTIKNQVHSSANLAGKEA